MNKILPKDRIRSQKVAGKQAKRWRNAGHERAAPGRTSPGPSSHRLEERSGTIRSAATPR